jgi:hypothetical protein
MRPRIFAAHSTTRGTLSRASRSSAGGGGLVKGAALIDERRADSIRKLWAGDRTTPPAGGSPDGR